MRDKPGRSSPMALSQKIAATALGILLLGGMARSAQNTAPGPDLVGIAATKAMHGELKHAIETNTLAQILASHVAIQNQQLIASTEQALRAQDALAAVAAERKAAEAEVARLAQHLAGQLTPADRNASNALWATATANQQKAAQREQALNAQLKRLGEEQTTRRAKLEEASGRLDDIEKSLGPARQ